MATTTVNVDVPIPVGKMLYVDSVEGNDSTGTRGRFDKPYLTPAAAKTDATSGDLIHVGPGAYAVTTNLAKSGVDWYFEQGATVTLVQDSTFGIFDDGGAAMTFSVRGFGEFTMNSNTEDHPFVGAFKTAHDSSNVQVHANSILLSTSAGDPSDSACAAFGSKGTLIVECADFVKSNTAGYCVYWENGPMHVTAPNIIGGGNGAVVSVCTAPPTGKLWVSAQNIVNEDIGESSSCIVDASTVECQVWIKALEIGNESDQACIGAAGAAKMYITAQKISAIAGEDTISQAGTNTTWITAQKITGGAKQIEVTSGTLHVDCPHLEEGASQTVGIDVQGGTLHLNGIQFTATNGNGIDISGGTAHITGLTIDTSSNAATNPIVKSGGTLNLNSVELIAEGTQDSITAATAQDVNALGSKVNRPVNANVTAGPDLFYDDGNEATGRVSTLNADGTWSWAAAASGAAWGDITGTLSAQTDLQTALDAKADKYATINDQSGTTYTLALADVNALVRLDNASSIALTVPANSTTAFPTGTRIQIQQVGAGQVTIAGAGAASGSINSFGNALKLAGQYARCELIKTDTDEWSLEGNLTV